MLCPVQVLAWLPIALRVRVMSFRQGPGDVAPADPLGFPFQQSASTPHTPGTPAFLSTLDFTSIPLATGPLLCPSLF